MANSWYAYLGANLPINNTTSYRKMTIDPLCYDGIGICAIYLHDQTDPNPTNLTPVLQYIIDALATYTHQPNGFNEKPFVYLKGL